MLDTTRLLGVGSPLAIHQNLVRRKLLLVVHFGAGFDPIAQIHMGKPELPRLLDLPQHAVGAVVGAGFGLIEGVHGRETIVQHIDNRHHFEAVGLAVLAGLDKLNESRIHSALEQKLAVLVDVVVVHATAGVAVVLVAQVQVVMRLAKAQRHHSDHQVAVALPGASLAAVGFKSLGLHTQRDAGLATIAMGAVGKHAAAPKTVGHQFGIGVAMDEVTGRGHLRAGLPVGQVAASVRGRRIKLDSVQRQFFELRHGLWGVGYKTKSQYTESKRQGAVGV